MAAPTPVSAYLHSTIVKLGIFLFFRFTPLLGLSNMYIYIVTFVGLITMLFGSITGLKTMGLKGILAYSTISQLGMIMAIVGIGGQCYNTTRRNSICLCICIIWCAISSNNHAIFKCALFMGVGILDHEAGSRDIRILSGMRQLFPKMNLVMTIAALSMAKITFF